MAHEPLFDSDGKEIGVKVDLNVIDRGTTAQCIYIGGHAEGFDPECFWCHRGSEVGGA